MHGCPTCALLAATVIAVGCAAPLAQTAPIQRVPLAVMLPPGGSYDLHEAPLGNWVDLGMRDGTQSYRYDGPDTGASVTVKDAAGHQIAGMSDIAPATVVRITPEGRLEVLAPKR